MGHYTAANKQATHTRAVKLQLQAGREGFTRKRVWLCFRVGGYAGSATSHEPRFAGTPVRNALKHLVHGYTGFLWALLKPLGSWAVFAVAGLDSAFFGLPLDPVVAGYVYRDRGRFLLYPMMAAAGSAVGCIILYVIGYKGGEALLERKIPRAKFERIRKSFSRHEFWALMLPSMAPPPFPFKLFVLSASVLEMNFWRFLLAIFAGRLLRFVALAVLVLKFGPHAVALFSQMATKHWVILSLAISAIVAVLVWFWLRGRWRSKGMDS